MNDESRSLLDAEVLRKKLEEEVLVMGLYLSGAGRALPPELVTAMERLEANERLPLRLLADAHAVLCEHVHPARPQALALLSRRGAFSEGGSAFTAVPITQRMMIVAVVSLFGAVLVGASPDITTDPAVGNPLTSSGVPFLVNQAYFMLTAALGAAFHAITTLNHHINDGTYDPRHDASYWTRLVLGVMSGTILSSLLEASEGEHLEQVGRNVLALLGGFSAGLVHRILERLVTSVESIFGAEPRTSGDTNRPSEPARARYGAPSSSNPEPLAAVPALALPVPASPLATAPTPAALPIAAGHPPAAVVASPSPAPPAQA